MMLWEETVAHVSGFGLLNGAPLSHFNCILSYCCTTSQHISKLNKKHFCPQSK